MQLRQYGLEVVGKLPSRPCVNRTEEIVDYVVDYDIKKFIIVDDDASLYSPKCKFLFLVDSKKGFSKSDVKRFYERYQNIYAEDDDMFTLCCPLVKHSNSYIKNPFVFY